ncbi:MAG: GTP-binding protein [Selenomonadaceae bacterium]|nr:GTP-binding protein [Selenomonadaceae bacterium]
MSSNDRMQLKNLKIGIFGKRSSGKSALINVLLGEDAAEVSETKETTYKAMDIKGVGAVTIVDTVGLDAEKKRVNKTQTAAEEINIALMLIANDSIELELAWMNRLTRSNIVVIPIVSQIDKLPDQGKLLAAAIREASGKEPIRVSAKEMIGIDELREKIIEAIK